MITHPGFVDEAKSYMYRKNPLTRLWHRVTKRTVRAGFWAPGAPLTEVEVIAFRKEIRALDTDIQNFFRLYYITGIVTAIGWIASQNPRLTERSNWNPRNVIGALLIVCFLNVVSWALLLYKGIEVQELAQFAFSNSPPDAAFARWERWRRGRYSATRYARAIEKLLISVVPALVSLGTLVLAWRLSSVHVCVVHRLTPGCIDATTAAKFDWARPMIAVVAVLHLAPVWLGIVSLLQVPRLWRILPRNGQWIDAGEREA